MTGRPHRAVRVDENQAEIIADLRKLGAVVWRLSDLGGEILDLLVCWRGKCVPVEIKAVGCEDDLTEGERKGIQRLQLIGVDPIVATCAEDVVAAWGEPHRTGPYGTVSWQVVDQASVEEFNKLMEKTLETAASLDRFNHASPHLEKRIGELRDLLLKSHDTFCRAIEKI